MTPSDRFQVLSILLSFIAIIVIPMLGLAIRSATRWTRIEAKVEEVTKDVRDLVEGKNEVHAAIYRDMKADRKATDQRLRWLEENLWNAAAKGGK